ncbi:hypothetical protein [Siminovitchia terrae]|nr:hypothetical protein [Siminovitchia terrae]
MSSYSAYRLADLAPPSTISQHRFRRIGSTSAGEATGRRDLSLPTDRTS